MASCTIVEVLAARDRRQREREQVLSLYDGTVVSLQLNIPGDEKDSNAYRSALEIAVAEIKSTIQGVRIDILKESVQFLKTGPEALFVFDTYPMYLKELMIAIEEQHPLGRLFDIDVYDHGGVPLSRTNFAISERKCLVCENLAKVCGRQRAHDTSVIVEKINEMIQKYEQK
ncbi:MAG: citrate lyase holo-[acyl-carrier protein] synthase [Clostridia bacterium]|nr:citrate lyase holo-[acyl-carrier protein] synthase [Clostridia bacterium]